MVDEITLAAPLTRRRMVVGVVAIAEAAQGVR